jgi:hypothetical protein
MFPFSFPFLGMDLVANYSIAARSPIKQLFGKIFARTLSGREESNLLRSSNEIKSQDDRYLKQATKASFLGTNALQSVPDEPSKILESS